MTSATVALRPKAYCRTRDIGFPNQLRSCARNVGMAFPAGMDVTSPEFAPNIRMRSQFRRIVREIVGVILAVPGNKIFIVVLLRNSFADLSSWRNDQAG